MWKYLKYKLFEIVLRYSTWVNVQNVLYRDCWVCSLSYYVLSQSNTYHLYPSFLRFTLNYYYLFTITHYITSHFSFNIICVVHGTFQTGSNMICLTSFTSSHIFIWKGPAAVKWKWPRLSIRLNTVCLLCNVCLTVSPACKENTFAMFHCLI